MHRQKTNKIMILSTLGPSSLSQKTIQKLERTGVDIFRINLSHTPVEDIEKNIRLILKATQCPVCIDTEGAQIRNGRVLGGRVKYREGSRVRIHKKNVTADSSNLSLYPDFVADKLEVGDLISIDFDTLLLKVSLVKEDFVETVVMSDGFVGSNKAVSVDRDILLAPFTDKDLKAFEIVRQYGLGYVALSFAGRRDDIVQLRKLIGGKARVISKIESRQGLENLEGIMGASDAILIDRGDLSRQVPLEVIPFFQKFIINKANLRKRPVYVATNLLESMVEKKVPTRAELNDVMNTLLDGADGLVMAAETAIGKYPIECVHMIKRMVSAFEKIGRSPKLLTAHSSLDISLAQVEPHGGALVNSFHVLTNKRSLSKLKQLVVDDTALIDAEQIAIGTYSPLDGFMTRDQVNGVLDDYRLPGGIIFTLPIVLQAKENDVTGFHSGEDIALVSRQDRDVYAVLSLEEIHEFNFKDIAQRWYGTDSLRHPGVFALKNKGNLFLGGKIKLVRRLDTDFKEFTFTPLQARHIFQKRGWTSIVGFHTRNVAHRAHEYLQMSALKKYDIDGLFIHPVIGPKKKMDFTPEIILKSYSHILRQHMPKNKVLLGAFLTYSRYAGPREAVFTAICRKNFGCTHFIIGRDHTGLGNFYAPDDAKKLLAKLGDIGIRPIFFDAVYYCKECNRHLERCGHGDDARLFISGTDLRNMITEGRLPPEWLMRRDVAELVLDEIKSGNEVFIR